MKIRYMAIKASHPILLRKLEIEIAVAGPDEGSIFGQIVGYSLAQVVDRLIDCLLVWFSCVMTKLYETKRLDAIPRRDVCSCCCA